jgi:hypothetical protein
LSRKRRARRAWRAFRAAPPRFRVGVVAVALLALAFAVNWVYQVVRKPAELFFPVSGVLSKTPEQTWRQYGPIFREHATAVITPYLLAALAQVEAAGNPVARTYWRWRLTTEPFDVYRPASSAVGMYQMTDAVYSEAKRFCVHDHVVAEDGPWYEFGSCWFNSLYLRVVPSHAVEMTSAYLHLRVTSILERESIHAATPEQEQDLAAVVHLCGAAAGDIYARHGFHLRAGQRCGDHDAARYLARVDAMRRLFARLATAH